MGVIGIGVIGALPQSSCLEHVLSYLESNGYSGSEKLMRWRRRLTAGLGGESYGWLS